MLHAAHHHIGRAERDERRPEGERMVERGLRRGGTHEAIGPPLPQQSHAGLAPGVTGHIAQHLHAAEAGALEPARRLLDAGIVAFGQHDASSRASRPFVDAIAKTHFPNFCLSALKTAG